MISHPYNVSPCAELRDNGGKGRLVSIMNLIRVFRQNWSHVMDERPSSVEYSPTFVFVYWLPPRLAEQGF